MKYKTHIVLMFLFLSTISLFSQEIKEMNYETFDAFLADQNFKIEAVEQGVSINEVKSTIGDAIRVKIPRVGRMKPLNKVFKQPEFINHFNKTSENPVDILWYFSDPKDSNGVISKRECTPIVLVNNKVVGKGWEFFNAFRKKQPLRQ